MKKKRLRKKRKKHGKQWGGKGQMEISEFFGLILHKVKIDYFLIGFLFGFNFWNIFTGNCKTFAFINALFSLILGVFTLLKILGGDNPNPDYNSNSAHNSNFGYSKYTQNKNKNRNKSENDYFS